VVRSTSARYRRAYELLTGTLLGGDSLPAAGPGGPA
jgi:hypothetical protein